MGLHKTFIGRQIRHAGRQTIVFVLCVQLSIMTLVALNGFSENVNRSLLKDVRSLHGADILVRSSYPISAPVATQVQQLRQRGWIDSATVREFYSVVRNQPQSVSLLCQLKVVTPGYPFYGRIELASGDDFSRRLQPGSIIVAQSVLDRLSVAVGDRLRIGEATLTIAGIVTQEPDRPVDFFRLGPRIFVHEADLAALDLIKPGSRVRYSLMIKVDTPERLDSIYQTLRTGAAANERVDTFRTAGSRVKRFFDNFFFFLALIGILTLLLAGIGIQSTLTAVLRELQLTIAIMKTVGATSRFIIRHYVVMVLVLGLSGTILGFLGGLGLQALLTQAFKGLLPAGMTPTVSAAVLVESLLLGLIVVALFCFLPLHRLKDVRPIAIFRKDPVRGRRGAAYYGAAATVALFFVFMVFWQLREVKIGIYFVLGILALIAISAFMVNILLGLLRRWRPKTLTLRQALKGLFRPGNLTRSILITLSVALSALFAIYLIERNLDDTFVKSYPPDVPNLFFIDIQASQLADFKNALGIEAEYYPIVRARVESINDVPIDRTKERRRRGDNLARPFNLTYRESLLEDERLIAGATLFDPRHPGLQVSILDEVAEIRPMGLGDRIAFNIQGVPLAATVVSIRSRERDTLKPFFYFVFKEAVLKDAPQTVFTAVTVPKREISALQTRMVSKFPNVSVFDVSATIASIAGVMRKLSAIVRFLGLFSMLAGILIIISSVFATRMARIQEAVYFKILGAGSGFVRRVLALENVLLGMISAGVAVLLSQIGSWAICTLWFDIDYGTYPIATGLMILTNTVLVILVGMLSSRSILQKKPVAYLREQSNE